MSVLRYFAGTRRFNHVLPLMHANGGTNSTGSQGGQLSSRALVEYLDNFIIGQVDAKRSLAIAIIDRARRMKITDENLRKAIIPSNILLLGPTGSGKTEVARRLAKKVDAPFVKVVATKYSEVGFVGDDTSSMIEELAEQAFQVEVDKLKSEVLLDAKNIAIEEVTTAFLNTKTAVEGGISRTTAAAMVRTGMVDDVEVEIESSLLDYAISRSSAQSEKEAPNASYAVDDPMDQPAATARTILSSRSTHRPTLSSHRGGNHRSLWRMVTVSHAVTAIAERSAVLLSRNRESELKDRAKRAIEERGIVFIDEFDKMISEAGEEGSSFNQKRRGVEKELLTLIEGTVVATKKLGPISTDHVVFICAGAFSGVSPKQIMPELQGRLPIRCEMKSLTKEDLVNILENVQYALPMVQRELMLVDGIDMQFTPCGIRAIAQVAFDMNKEIVNTGARRLNTVMGIVLEEIKFNAEQASGQVVTIDELYVNQRMDLVRSGTKVEDLRRFVL